MFVHTIGANHVVDFREREVEDVLSILEHLCLDEAVRLMQQRLLVDEMAADDAELRILAVAGEGLESVDHPSRLAGFRRPVRQSAQPFQERVFGPLRLLLALLHLPLGGTGLEIPDVAEDEGEQGGGAFAPSWSGDVDLAGAAHAIAVEVALNRVPRFAPT